MMKHWKHKSAMLALAGLLVGVLAIVEAALAQTTGTTTTTDTTVTTDVRPPYIAPERSPFLPDESGGLGA